MGVAAGFLQLHACDAGQLHQRHDWISQMTRDEARAYLGLMLSTPEILGTSKILTPGKVVDYCEKLFRGATRAEYHISDYKLPKGYKFLVSGRWKTGGLDNLSATD